MKQLIIVGVSIIAMLILSNYFFEYVISRPMDGTLQLLLFIAFGVLCILSLVIIIKQLIKFFNL